MNEQLKIKRQYESIQKKFAELHAKLMVLQIDCQHPNKESINRSDTGNYDRGSDRYWTTHDCKDCGKHWSTDQ